MPSEVLISSMLLHRIQNDQKATGNAQHLLHKYEHFLFPEL